MLLLLQQVQEAFENLLELLAYQQHAARLLQLRLPQGCSTHSTTEFLHQWAVAVLGMSVGCKGRYAPVAALLPRIGAIHMLQIEPHLVDQALTAMQDDMVANSATGFFRVLLQKLKEEADNTFKSGLTNTVHAESQAAMDINGSTSVAVACGNVSQQQDPLMVWCRWWLNPVLQVLWGTNDRLRSYVANHALPVIFQIEPRLLHIMVTQVLDQCSHHTAEVDSLVKPVVKQSQPVNATAALVVILKAARQLQLLSDLDGLVCHAPLTADHAAAHKPQMPEALQPTSLSSSVAANSAVHHAVDHEVNGVDHKMAAVDHKTDVIDQQAGMMASVNVTSLLLNAISSGHDALRLECLELACVNPRYACNCMLNVVCFHQSNSLVACGRCMSSVMLFGKHGKQYDHVLYTEAQTV